MQILRKERFNCQYAAIILLATGGQLEDTEQRRRRRQQQQQQLQLQLFSFQHVADTIQSADGCAKRVQTYKHHERI